MAHAFNVIPAKPTFGTLREHLYQSDYINRKKRIIALSCRSKNKVVSSINKNNLIIGLYTKENLQNVCTISTITSHSCNNVEIEPNKILYQNYVIDPLGELFGNTQCGELNYTQYFQTYH